MTAKKSYVKLNSNIRLLLKMHREKSKTIGEFGSKYEAGEIKKSYLNSRRLCMLSHPKKGDAYVMTQSLWKPPQSK